MYTAKEQEFVKEIHKAIKFADDRFQRSRATEYKYIFGMLRGALMMGLDYKLYSALFSHVWTCRQEQDVDDMGDPYQEELMMSDSDND